MFKFLVITSLFTGMGLLPMTAWSGMSKRFQEAQAFFSEDISLLATLVDDVLTNNPGIRGIQAKVDASSAQHQAASQALYNPKLEMDYENSEINTTSLGIIQTIDWFDKRGGRSQVARYVKNQSIASLSVARQSLAAELLINLSDYHTARNKDALTKLRIELLQEFVILAKKRYQSGDVNQAELSLAQLAFAEATMQRSRVSSQLIAVHQSLITLTDSDQNQWPGLPTQLPLVELKNGQLEEIINHLPITQEQLSRVEAAMAKVQLRSRERNADPTIGLRAGREDSDTLIGLTISIPINVRNTYKAEVNVANAQLIQAEFEGQNLERLLKSQLVSTVRRYQLVREAWLSWQEIGQTSMANQFSLIHRQWEASEISTTDYFLQLNQTLDTRLSAIELRQEFWRAWIDWLKASSGVTQWLKLKNDSEETL